MNLHFLLTDYLIWLLVLISVVYAVYVSRHEHLLAPWRQVLHSHVGAATGVILAAYVFIGLIDSIHYYPELETQAAQSEATTTQSGELLSLFDWLVSPMRNQVETTYSKPFATHSFSKKTIELEDGQQIRSYPRLKYAGAHLEDVNEASKDIFYKGLTGAVYGLDVWLVVVLLCCLARAKAKPTHFLRHLKGLLFTSSALRTASLVLLLLCVVSGASYYLSIYYHIWGTDKVGYDVFYITLKSIRTGLVIGTLTTLVMLPLALTLGMSAGYFKGWIDDVVQYLYTTLNAIPGVLLIAAAVLMLDVYMYNHADKFTSLIERADWRLFFICLILGITSWTGLCRLLRAEILKLREMDYVNAATAFGVRHRIILLKHLLPNVMHLVLISIVLDFSGLVLAEAVLSYVGIGVDPTTHSWGNMINSARLEMAREPMVWWSLTASFIAMFGLVLCANLFTDVVRDAFDPRLRERR